MKKDFLVIVKDFDVVDIAICEDKDQIVKLAKNDYPEIVKSIEEIIKEKEHGMVRSEDEEIEFEWRPVEKNSWLNVACFDSVKL